MWTNVFKIGGLHQISWFQFLPNEPDLSTIIDKSVKADQKDAATLLVLSSHLQLQKLGCLSTWTNSFVGPWDPSQGLHNPDEKIKLWLFLPGRHSSVIESAQPAVSRLKVVASGLWLAPGDSEEVAAALSQALRNCIERALVDLSYMRFGDVFSKYHPSQSEELSSRGKPTVEFIFAATEEALFVHVIISAKHVRALSGSDLERVSKHSMDSTYRLPVIVSPHGMRGRLIGSCPSDLVKQVYFSSGKLKASNGVVGLPYHVWQGFGYQLMGRSCYAEVALGLSKSGGEKTFQPNGVRNLPRHHPPEGGRSEHKVSPDPPSACEKSFIYPTEAVLVPILQTSFARSSLRRFWLQNWMGSSMPASSFFMHCAGNVESADSLWSETHGMRTQNGYDSSSNSNSSSISSLSRTSSDSENKINTGSGELEADADSLSCRQSGLSSGDLMEHDASKLGSKRTRTGMTESIGQVVTAGSGPMQDAYKSQYCSLGNDNSVVTGIVNDLGSHWDWDDDERGMGMDIQALLSEFGDFGDFFEDDALPFGEPPGTAESQALMFSAPECGDVGSSPAGVLDVPDQMLLPIGFPSFENFNSPPPPAAMDESLNKSKENMNNATVSASTNHTQLLSTGEFDHIIKAEALMTFASEFGAVETPTSELSTTLFRSPYLPKSREVDSLNSSSNTYHYSAAPPPSPCIDGLEVKRGMGMTPNPVSGNQDGANGHQSKHYYTHVESRRDHNGKRSHACSDSIATVEGVGVPPFANISSNNGHGVAIGKMTEGTLEMEHFLLPMKNVLATEIECVLFQASMCQIRHVLLSSSSLTLVTLSRFNGTMLNQLSNDPSTITENASSKYDLKKKESIPLRIAGDIDGGMLDGHLTAPVGVWRTVGVPKVGKPSTSPNMEVSSSFSHNSFNDDTILSYGQRQPLQELLDGISLLVQQATTFVDLSLDSDCGDGPYGWLALQEQWRRGFSCGPSMVHAGCGGTLASCHSLDIAGVELVDPFYSDVHASSLVSLLQSDIKSALKSAFSSLEGPLSVIDWCKGRSLSSDAGSVADGFSAESGINELRDFCGEPLSPSQSSVTGTSSLKVSSIIDGPKVDDQRRAAQDFCSSDSEQQPYSGLKPTLIALPFPSILVGYQDDWLKTSASSLQFWDKAPFEPYAMQKPVTYCVICPDIDPLTVAAADFFQQLGTVYETCKLGTHLPQILGNQMEVDSGKGPSTGFVFLDSPQSMKIESSNASLVGSISDYFLSLSNGWDLTSYLKSLSKALRALKLGPYLTSNTKEGSSGCSQVIYVVCPFPDPTAVLQTIVESSVAVGSVVHQSDRDRRAILHNNVGKALSGLAAVDEASVSNIPVLSGFSVPKLVLQIVTVDAIFRVTNPAISELVILKETAFTVYNKARRISRGSYNEKAQTSLSGRPHAVLTQMSPPISGMWKDCVGPRITGHSLPREGDIDASLRSGPWDSAWQPTRPGGLTCDPNRVGDLHDELRYMFEPLFILSEPGSLDNCVPLNVCGNLASESSKILPEDASGGLMQIASGSTESASSSQVDGSEHDQKTSPSLHCCYGWTEDWRWLVCIWTDSRGELLDTNVFPFGGISSRQDTKGLQCLFVQVLQQGCQILQACLATDSSFAKSRDFVITRIGNFYELEYLEWQKAVYSVGSSEMKRWPLQLRRLVADGVPASSNGSSLQSTEMSLIQERTLPSSPGPLYSPVAKSPFMKGSLGQSTARKQMMGVHSMVDNSRSLLQWAQSISFLAVSIDHSLQLLHPANTPSLGGSSGNGVAPFNYVEGFTPVKSLGSTPASYILIPSPSMRFLPSTPLQLPTCLTAESPPLAHLLHSKGSAVPLSTGFVVSKAVPSMRRDCSSSIKDEWPSVLSIGLVDYYGSSNTTHERIARGITKQSGRSLSWEPKDLEIETHVILESLAAELHGLSWMTVSPAYLERRTALPFHCDMVLRLRRLLHFADKDLSRQSEKW